MNANGTTLSGERTPAHQTYPSTLGTPQPYRDAIAETLAGAGAYIEIGQSYALVADDAGLDHAVRCLVAHTRSAVSLLADLKEMKATQARRRAEAQAGGRQ